MPFTEHFLRKKLRMFEEGLSSHWLNRLRYTCGFKSYNIIVCLIVEF